MVAGSIALVAPAVAGAEPTPVINIDKMLQTGQPGDYEPGDSITYRYEITGNERFINVAVTDDKYATVQAVLGGGPGGAYARSTSTASWSEPVGPPRMKSGPSSGATAL